MSQLLEVKRTPEGKLLARRKDGQPLTPQDREEARLVAEAGEEPLRAWVVEEVRGESGSLRAVQICSAVLQDHFWLVLDRTFIPRNGASYYPEELPLLKGKTPEDLRQIHTVKLSFPGCRVIQEGPEKIEAEERPNAK